MMVAQGIVRRFCVGIAMFVAPLAGQRPPDVAERVAAIEQLDSNDLYYARNNAAIEALAAAWTTAQVRTLIGDADPKVRAIALVVLHEQLGRRAMPELLQFLDDAGAAPPQPLHFVQVPGQPKVRPQTVGEIATALFAQYLPLTLTKRHVGRENTIGVPQLRKAYADYVRTRQDRAHCLVWFRVALQRASGGSSPTSAERLPRIQAVRRQIDAVPAPERHWYLLVLANDWQMSGREHLATEAELVAAAKALGPDVLLTLLRGIGPADVRDRDPSLDPDLVAERHGPMAWEALAAFLLRHGAAWLPAGRCDEWLQLEQLHHANRGGGLGGGHYGIDAADWSIVAAELQPDRARGHVKAGFASIPIGVHQRERGRLALAACRLLGDEGLQRAVQWFYTEWAELDFVEALAQPEHAALFWALVRDERFLSIGWGVVANFARVCNAHVAPAPFPLDTLGEMQHPLGGFGNPIALRDFHDGSRSELPYAPRGVMIADARAKHPEETKRLELTIADLRTRLRELAAQRAK